jgi:hypothetical protein
MIVLKLCDIDGSGFCHRCQTQIVNTVTEEESSCPDFGAEVSHYNDDGDWDYEKDDANSIEDIIGSS